MPKKELKIPDGATACPCGSKTFYAYINSADTVSYVNGKQVTVLSADDNGSSEYTKEVACTKCGEPCSGDEE